MEPSSIAAAFAGVKHAIDIAGFLKSADGSLEQAEYKLKVAELFGALADVKMQIAGLQEVLINKETENRKLTEKLEIKESMNWEHPYYWMQRGGQKDGPFCGQCWDSKKLTVRLVSSD